ncbi:hypothetical protein, partial [uncultured Nostoc sp.]|uniref:hypothetical protein n=1 Tax=uncultured Nostoc sp. TaxID=340711 RepID=UPI0035CC7911
LCLIVCYILVNFLPDLLNSDSKFSGCDREVAASASPDISFSWHNPKCTLSLITIICILLDMK